WKGWAISHRQKQKKLIMLPSETMIWQPEFTDKTLSRKPGAVHKSLFRILCKCLFSEVTVQAVTELDNKAAHCHSPVLQRHRP
ncbi:hypothetical protein PIA90_30230, partial [Escherichia coli]|uniref:hypothetical protein n=1 Tax=Escherichia coli TaxID=562 RepID=UPI0022F3BA44